MEEVKDAKGKEEIFYSSITKGHPFIILFLRFVVQLSLCAVFSAQRQLTKLFLTSCGHPNTKRPNPPTPNPSSSSSFSSHPLGGRPKSRHRPFLNYPYDAYLIIMFLTFWSHGKTVIATSLNTLLDHWQN